MKKIIFLLLVSLSLASCYTLDIPQSTTTNIIDYSEFAEQGIFVTESNSVNFDYKPLGSVVSFTRGSTRLFLNSLDQNKAFTEIASKVKEIGGNGLINFNVRASSTYEVLTMTVSGMAIYTDFPFQVASTIAPSVDAPESPSVAKPKNDIYIDDIHCFVFKKFKGGFAVITEAALNLEQVKRAYLEFGMTDKECQFFLPNTKSPYMGVTENGYIIDYNTNEFIPLK